MGVGMALLEQTHYDPQNGAPINSSLADYLVAVNADAPQSEVHFLDYPDKELNEVGARGITVNTIQPGPIDTDLNPAASDWATPSGISNAIANT